MEDDQGKKAVNGSVSGEGKLWIKIKIPPKGEDEEEEEISSGGGGLNQKKKEDPQARVCNVCKKGFSSGKALGGHMRVHVQPYKDVFLKKLKTNNHLFKKKQKHPQQQQVDNQNGERRSMISSENPTCSICKKKFPSMKSLFGHMRCHPEREWRGIQPPPNVVAAAAAAAVPAAAVKNSSPSSSVSNADYSPKLEEEEEEEEEEEDQVNFDDDGSNFDLIKRLPSWSVTAKRGRKSVAMAVPTTTEEDRIRDAVQDLMRLAQGDSLNSSTLTHNKQNNNNRVEVTNSNSLTNKVEIEDKNLVLESRNRRIEESPVDYSNKKLRIDEKEEERGKGKQADHELDTPMGTYEWVCANWPRKDYYSKNKLDEDNESDIRNGDVVGGITSSILPLPSSENQTNKKFELIKMRKRRKKLKLRDLEDQNQIQNSTPFLAQPDNNNNNSSTNKYKCSTCNKCFPTHQALGGHRSSHNKIRTITTTTTTTNTNVNIDESVSEEDHHHHHQQQQQQLLSNPFSGEGDGMKENEGAGSSTAMHRCKICSKIFPTGQALGGHQRCHWTGPAEIPSSQAISSPGEGSQTGRKVLGFDLNEVPTMDEDEDGYSSHSSVS